MLRIDAPASADARKDGHHPSVEMFPLFVMLYVTGFMMEMVESWRDPVWINGLAVALSLVTIALARSREIFFLFLVVTTAYFLVYRFPDVANHVNLLIFCNLLLILGIGHSYVSRLGRADFSSYFETLLSPLRLVLIVTYFAAGFHKLNYDFLNPAVSCINGFINNFLWTLTTPSLGERFPISLASLLLFVFLVLVLLAYRLVRPIIVRMAIAGTVLLIAGTIFLATDAFDALVDSLTSGSSSVVLGLAVVIVFWQLIEGPLLLFPRFQAYFLSFALVFHTYLGMIGFVDFQALAVALLLAFVPKAVLEAWGQERYMRFGSVQLDRVLAYVGLNLLAGLLTGIDTHVVPIVDNRLALQGVLFNGGVLILIWPLLAGLLRGTRNWSWDGVSVFSRKTPKFLYSIPALLLLFASTSYLGLRTAGNFSMFSNLQTEGTSSNHVLLGNNPLKLWDYQENIVRVLRIDRATAELDSNYFPSRLTNMGLPLVEFKKVVDSWEGRVVPIVFEYQGETYVSRNITADENWRPARWDWEMRLLDFRPIQLEGANLCRW